ncbi:hypothetical protein MBANPS3_009499 [Mucor bainieri]
MDILYSHLSTLFSLWTSVELDACSMNNKLHIVIQELEKLVRTEKREKLLLAANIEDAMTNIDSASQLLGVSLENMLYSSINHDRINISPEILSIYNDLNPTFPKQKALTELDSRLTHLKKYYYVGNIHKTELCERMVELHTRPVHGTPDAIQIQVNRGTLPIEHAPSLHHELTILTGVS